MATKTHFVARLEVKKVEVTTPDPPNSCSQYAQQPPTVSADQVRVDEVVVQLEDQHWFQSCNHASGEREVGTVANVAIRGEDLAVLMQRLDKHISLVVDE